METVLSRLAEQLPVAVLLIVFIILWTDRMDKAQDRRDVSQEKRDEMMRQFWAGQQTSNREVLERLANSVEKVATRLDEHDKKTDSAVARMEERTRPIPKRRYPNAKTE